MKSTNWVEPAQFIDKHVYLIIKAYNLIIKLHDCMENAHLKEESQARSPAMERISGKTSKLSRFGHHSYRTLLLIDSDTIYF